MTMFPHTVTVYNVEIVTDKDTIENVLTNHITILRGVFLDASKAVNVLKSGLVGADAAMLYIPPSAQAVDGVTGKKKRYVPPVEFWRSEDKSEIWTLSVGGTKTPGVDGSSFFVKGEVVDPDHDVQLIEMAYDHVYDITSVDDKDYGGLRHIEVGAK